MGPAFDKYEQLGGCKGEFGYPVNDMERGMPGPSYPGWAVRNLFQKGVIFSIYSGGTLLAKEVVGATWFRYKAADGDRGFLGLPRTGREFHLGSNAYYNIFQNGVIWNWSGGTSVLYGKILELWKDHYGGENGKLGIPVTDVLPVPECSGTVYESGEFDRDMGQTTYCRFQRGIIYLIEKPIVTKSGCIYSGIEFLEPGQLEVFAGGCVQTGGGGETWKRYVNPKDSDDNYMGTLEVKGASVLGSDGLEEVGKETISQFVSWTNSGKNIYVLDGTHHVAIGYKDDDHSDNGYYLWDRGTEGQCVGAGNAWIALCFFQPGP